MNPTVLEGGDKSKATFALMGPSATAAKPSNPTLAAHFEVDGDLSTFDDAALLRRLATLLGIEDAAVGATLSAGANVSTVVVDAEIECPDATTLVMAAKTLKKGIQPLGLALGVRFVSRPMVEVSGEGPPGLATSASGSGAGIEPAFPPPPPGPDTPGASVPSAGGPFKRFEKMADQMVPTIQERIPSLAGRGGLSGLGGRIGLGLGVSPSLGSAGPGPMPSTAGSQIARPDAGASALPKCVVQQQPSSPLGAPQGIQERIPFSGIGGNARGGRQMLRLRSAQALGGGGMAGLPQGSPSGPGPPQVSVPTKPPANLLGGLGLGMTSAAESAVPPMPALPSTMVKDGIQERLPAMPGLRKRESRAPSAGKRLAVAPPPAPAPPSSPPPSPPINERMAMPTAAAPAAAAAITATVAHTAAVINANMAKPSRSVLPAVPVQVAPKACVGSAPVRAPNQSPTSTSTAMVLVAAPKGLLVNSSKVMPRKTAPPQPPAPPPARWDDRAPQAIVWGALREHTLIGGVMAILYGDGPKLPTIAQATQLLCCTLLGLLYLSTVQLRYSWYGATWGVPEAPPDGTRPPLVDRLSTISAVAIAAALACWSSVLMARWLFLFANRANRSLPPRQGQLIYTYVWSIVLLVCGAMAIGAMSMSTNMDKTVVHEDVMLGWILALGVQWVLIEPVFLGLLATGGLLLRWCTAFDDLPSLYEQWPPKKNAKNG